MRKKGATDQQKVCVTSMITIMLIGISLSILLFFEPSPVLAENQSSSDRETQADPDHQDLIAYDSVDLIEQARLLDGQMIIYQGEVIGDVMRRKDGYWINVLNHESAIGIWLNAEQRALITVAGKYNVQGDQIVITGRFNRACPEHGGDLDIHAGSIEIVRPGFTRPAQIDWSRLILASLMLVLAISCLIVLQVSRNRHPQKKSKI